MAQDPREVQPQHPAPAPGYDINDFSDMLEEFRLLLPGAQLLTAFLITLPFLPGFGEIVHSEKVVFMATFVCAIAALVFFSAPATQHRILWPLRDRVAFKRFASYEMLAGAIMLSFALVLASYLVIAELFGSTAGVIVAAAVALLIGSLWWLLPLILKRRRRM